jgi:hypothetical protein
MTTTTDTTTAFYAWGSEQESIDNKQMARIVSGVDEVVRSAKQAIKELEELVAKVTAVDPEEMVLSGDRALSAVQHFARHAGYSNSPATYVAETYAAAGKVAGQLEMVF